MFKKLLIGILLFTGVGLAQVGSGGRLIDINTLDFATWTNVGTVSTKSGLSFQTGAINSGLRLPIMNVGRGHIVKIQGSVSAGTWLASNYDATNATVRSQHTMMTGSDSVKWTASGSYAGNIQIILSNSGATFTLEAIEVIDYFRSHIDPPHISGAGTSGDPYILYDPSDLDSINTIGVGDAIHWKLNNDIDGDSLWMGRITGFRGEFDGDGFEIKNFNRDDKVPGVTTAASVGARGFFACRTTGTAVIKNVTFRNLFFNRTSTSTVFGGQDGQALIIESTWTGAAVHLDNVIVKQCSLYQKAAGVNGTAYHYGIVHGIGSSALSAHRLSIDSCYLDVELTTATGDVLAGLLSGRTTIDSLSEVSITNNFIRLKRAIYTAATTTDIRVALLGRIDGVLGSGIIKNSYTYNNVIKDSSGFRLHGAFINLVFPGGIPSFTFDNIYQGKNTTTADTVYNFTEDIFQHTFSDCFSDTATSTTILDSTKAGVTLVDSTLLKDKAMFEAAGWDFADIWAINTGFQSGMPYHQWAAPRSLEIIKPELNDIYSAEDTVTVTIVGNNVPIVYLYYSNDNKFSWTIIDTITIPVDTIDYIWDFLGNGEYHLRATSEDSVVIGDSEPFFLYGEKYIEILSPLDDTEVNTNGTLIVDIEIITWNLTQFSLYYAVGDTITWIPIVIDIAVTNDIDTTTYAWNVPFVYGEIWLMAREISDTALYDFERDGYLAGNILRNEPLLCWYHSETGYFGNDFTNYYSRLIEWNWAVDRRCGWAAPSRFEVVTSVISDKAEGYSFLSSHDYPDLYPDNRWADVEDTPLQSGGVFLYTLTDTTFYRWPQFYPYSTTELTYKLRRYFIDATDSTLRVDDLLNGIDSLLVVDFKPFFKDYNGSLTGWFSLPDKMEMYHTQKSKLDSLYFPTNQDFESLNDVDFKPKLLVNASNAPRGRTTYVVDALDFPIDPIYVQDVARMFTSLSFTRDYFRGIHPKAEKRKDPNNP